MPAYESCVAIEQAPVPLRRPRRRWWVCGTALMGFLLFSVACERSAVDVRRALRVADMTTGWLDVG